MATLAWRSSRKTRLLFVLIIPAIALNLAAQEAHENRPEPVRTILERHDQSDVSGKEIVIGTATLAKRTYIGFHTHPGDEAGYVVRGTVVLRTRGKPDRILHAGESFFNPRGAIHSLAALDSDSLAVSSWIVDKGAQLATPVP